jgi:hypothetical protein
MMRVDANCGKSIPVDVIEIMVDSIFLQLV